MSVRKSILLAAGLLGAHVLGRAHDLAGGGEPAVARPLDCLAMPKSMSRTTPARVAHDVRGLEVAVDDADVVDGLQPLGDLDRDLERLLGAGSAPCSREQLLEVDALDVLHGDVAQPAVLAVLVDAADVAVADLARELDLVAEAPRHARRVFANSARSTLMATVSSSMRSWAL